MNCTPLSVVMSAGTPNLATQEEMKASMQLAEEVSDRGMASNQRVERSTMVSRWLWPEVEDGRGPTRSRWTCAKRRSGAGKADKGAVNCLVVFALWQ